MLSFLRRALTRAYACSTAGLIPYRKLPGRKLLMFDPADLDLYDELTLDELREDRAAGGAQARLGRRDRRFIDALQSSLRIALYCGSSRRTRRSPSTGRSGSPRRTGSFARPRTRSIGEPEGFRDGDPRRLLAIPDGPPLSL